MATAVTPAARHEVAQHVLAAVALVVAAMVVSALLEPALAETGSQARRVIGLAGTLMMLGALAYPLRRHRVVVHGSLKGWLAAHELLGTLGPVLLVVHGGVRYHSYIPVLALALAVLMMLSGFLGRALNQRAQARLPKPPTAEPSATLTEARIREVGASPALLTWRLIHYPLTAAFHAVAIVHLIAVFYYGGLFP